MIKKLSITVGPNAFVFEGEGKFEVILALVKLWFSVLTNADPKAIEQLTVQLKAGREVLQASVEAND